MNLGFFVQVLYNGTTLGETAGALAANAKLHNIVKMVDADLVLQPLLTVRETLQYAEQFQVAVPVSCFVFPHA